jgi:hypothetical protein
MQPHKGYPDVFAGEVGVSENLLEPQLGPPAQ